MKCTVNQEAVKSGDNFLLCGLLGSYIDVIITVRFYFYGRSKDKNLGNSEEQLPEKKKKLSVDCWQTVGRQMTDGLPTGLPTVGQYKNSTTKLNLHVHLKCLAQRRISDLKHLFHVKLLLHAKYLIYNGVLFIFRRTSSDP